MTCKGIHGVRAGNPAWIEVMATRPCYSAAAAIASARTASS